MSPARSVWLPLLVSVLASALWTDLTISAVPISDDESEQSAKLQQIPFSDNLTIISPPSALKTVRKTATGAAADSDDDADHADHNDGSMATAANRKFITSPVKHGSKVSGELPASPADLLRPDKFQFYTYNEQGDMITRQMTLEEIQMLIASGGAGQASILEMHEPQKADDMFAGGKNVMDVVEKVQNVLRSALSKPSSSNLMGSQPSIPEQANAEWSSILPSILSGDTENIMANETKEELAQNEKLDPPSVPTSHGDNGILVTLSNGTGISNQDQQQATNLSAEQKVKPYQPPETSVRPDYPRNPMIPVPVITAEEILSTQLPIPVNHSTVFQIMNVLTTDDIGSNKTETVSDEDIAGNGTSTMLATLGKISSLEPEPTTVRTSLKTTVQTTPEVTTMTPTLATVDYVRKPGSEENLGYVKITPMDPSMIQVKTSVPSTTTEKANVISGSSWTTSTFISNATTSMSPLMEPITLKNPPDSTVVNKNDEASTKAETKDFLTSKSTTPSVGGHPNSVDKYPVETDGFEMTSTEPNMISMPSVMNVSKEQEKEDVQAINVTWTTEASTELNEMNAGSSILAAPTRIEMENGTELSEELSDAFSSVMSQVSEAIPTVWYVSYTPEPSVTRMKVNDAVANQQDGIQLADDTKSNLHETTRVTEPYQEARIDELTSKAKLTTPATYVTSQEDADVPDEPDEFSKDSNVTTVSEKYSASSTVSTASTTTSSPALLDVKETTVDTLYLPRSPAPTPSTVNNAELQVKDNKNDVTGDRLTLDSVSVINQMLETVSPPLIPQSLSATASLTLPTDRPIHLLHANTVASSLIAGAASTSTTSSTLDTNGESTSIRSSTETVEESVESTTGGLADATVNLKSESQILNKNTTMPSTASTVANTATMDIKSNITTWMESLNESTTAPTTVTVNYNARPSDLGVDEMSVESLPSSSSEPAKVTETTLSPETTNVSVVMADTTVDTVTNITTESAVSVEGNSAPISVGTPSLQTMSSEFSSTNDESTVRPTVTVSMTSPTAVIKDVPSPSPSSPSVTESNEENGSSSEKEAMEENSATVRATTVTDVKMENDPEPTDEWTLISQRLSSTTGSTSPPTISMSSTVPGEKSTTTDNAKVPLGTSQTVSGLESSIRGTSSDVIAFSRLCNELAFSFWTATNKGLSTGRSLALSPFGMTSLLAMIFLGARGPTSEQMNELLRLDDVATFNPHLIFQNVTDAVGLARGQGIANAAFVRELFADKSKVRKLMPFYKEQAHQFYEGLIAEVNFATISDLARRRTNLLIRKQTGGRVKDFVRSNAVPLRPPLAALSANVFQTDCTLSGASSIGRDGELYFAVSPAVRQRRLVPVPATVWRTGVLAGYEPSLDATAVALGGVDRLVSTIFLLPGQQGHAAPGDTLDRLEQRLIAGAFRDGAWDKLLKVLVPRTGLELQIPKFSHRSVVNATAALKRMGLDQLFSTHADLKGINGVGNRLHLADVLQMNLFSTCGDESMSNGRHHVEIYPASPPLRNSRADDHEDTSESEEFLTLPPVPTRATHVAEVLNRREREKVATTAATTTTTATLTVERPRLKLDRPFLYFVRHNPTGLLLHMGRFNPRLLP